MMNRESTVVISELLNNPDAKSRQKILEKIHLAYALKQYWTDHELMYSIDNLNLALGHYRQIPESRLANEDVKTLVYINAHIACYYHTIAPHEFFDDSNTKYDLNTMFIQQHLLNAYTLSLGLTEVKNDKSKAMTSVAEAISNFKIKIPGFRYKNSTPRLNEILKEYLANQHKEESVVKILIEQVEESKKPIELKNEESATVKAVGQLSYPSLGCLLA